MQIGVVLMPQCHMQPSSRSDIIAFWQYNGFTSEFEGGVLESHSDKMTSHSGLCRKSDCSIAMILLASPTCFPLLLS